MNTRGGGGHEEMLIIAGHLTVEPTARILVANVREFRVAAEGS